MNLPDSYSCSIAVIGLGYVGMPLAVEFAKNKYCVHTGLSNNRKVIGFYINKQRLAELEEGFDRTKELVKKYYGKK